MEEITIPFRNVKAADLQGPEDYYKTVSDVYTGRYLEALGVQPTAANRRFVAWHAPLKECNIEAAWNDESKSAVAEGLTIRQPKIGQTHVAVAAQTGAIQRNSLPSAVRERVDFMSTAMPEMPSSAFQEAECPTLKWSNVDAMSAAFLSMKKADDISSNCLRDGSVALTKELEQTRVQIRTIKADEAEAPELESDIRDRLEQELAKLKCDFILPYASERRKPGSDRAALIAPWQHLQSSQYIEVPEELRVEALQPLVVTLDEIQKKTGDFAEDLPLELLTNRSDPALFAPVRSQLIFSDAVRLTGLLAHLLYWVIFGHLHPKEKQLPESSVQALKVTVHDLWSALIAPYRDFPTGVSFVIPVFCLSIKKGVKWIFTSRYPSVFSQHDQADELCRQLVEQINVLFMQLFDPDCVYARFGALDSTKQAVKLWKKLDLALASRGQGTATRMIQRKNRTSTTVNTLMDTECTGRPGNAKTRKLLAKSASDTILTSGHSRTGSGKNLGKAGAAGVKHAKKTQMDEFKQEALFQVACKQLSRTGLEGLPMGPGAATASRALARAASATTTRAASAAGGRGSSLNGRRRRALRAITGRGISPVRDKRPTTMELMQKVGQI
jgi:hypothetical protein